MNRIPPVPLPSVGTNLRRSATTAFSEPQVITRFKAHRLFVSRIDDVLPLVPDVITSPEARRAAAECAVREVCPCLHRNPLAYKAAIRRVLEGIQEEIAAQDSFGALPDDGVPDRSIG
jgi:hypothetical protein